VVSVREGVVDDVPGCLVGQLLFIDEDPEQLNSTDGRVGVVELNFVKLRELSPIRVSLLESADDVIQRGRTEEILLL